MHAIRPHVNYPFFVTSDVAIICVPVRFSYKRWLYLWPVVTVSFLVNTTLIQSQLH